MAVPLKDKDPMPFGAHKGKPMEKVPADYLDYISGQDWLSKWAVIDKELADPKSYGNG